MKYLKNFLITLLFSQVIFAQDINECRKVVDITIESINNGSSESLSNYLSDDFTIAGQEGELAKKVLNLLFSQLGDSVKSYDEVKQNKTDSGLELVYNIDYERKGLKEATFIFNESNLLKDLTLFEMEVKTKKDSKIEKSSLDIIEIPFTMARNLIAVKVLLNGEYRTFILDTGASGTILNSKYIAENDTSMRSISSSEGVSGIISGLNIEKVELLDFSGIKMSNQKILTLDLSHLEESLETKLYGLIGYDMIKDYDIIFDYNKLKITLINPSIFKKYKDEDLSDVSLDRVPFDLEGHIPIVKAQVGNTTLSYGIDCGAESNLISDKLFEPLKSYIKRIKIDKLIGVGNQPKEVKKGKVKKTKIGNKYFKRLKTVFSDISHLNEGYKIDIDGLIGYEVLCKQRTLISYNRKEMIFIE